MKEKLISVIIPCYNVEPFLPHCVSSLLNQTIGIENLELIFVDDASTDGTLEYLYELEQQYPSEIMVIACSENQGLGAARNVGLNYATGKYIGFVDADDWILPQMYEEMYQKAEQTGCEMVDSYACRTENRCQCARGRFQDAAYDSLFEIQSEKQRKELLAAGLTLFSEVCVWSKLYRRDFLEEYQLRYEEKYVFEDVYFLYMLLFYVHKFCVMQAEYYHYFIHAGSIMTTMDSIRWFEQRQNMQAWLKECIERGLFEKYYEEIAFIFGREYYLSNLHYAFTHDTDNIELVVTGTQKAMNALFLNVEKNPYILRGDLHECQKELFRYVSEGFCPEEITRIRERYLGKVLEIVNKKEPKTEEMNIMLAADKNYFYPAMVLITSLFYNHPQHKMTVYLLQKGFDTQDLEEVQAFANRWEGKEICCIEVSAEHMKSLKAFGRFSVAAFFRILGIILIPESVQRILYLDADMVVNHNLSELFLREMEQPIAACYDVNNYLQGNIEWHKSALGIPREYSYFNSGMLLMDLAYMRENKVAEKLILDIEEHFEEYSLVDQDALNRYFYKSTEFLPWQEYNCPCVPFLSKFQSDSSPKSLIRYFEVYAQGQNFQGYDITETLIENAGIIHFCTSQKPWRDRDFYESGNMKTAMRIYRQYEKLYAGKDSV